MESENIQYRYDVYLQDLEGNEALWKSGHNRDALDLISELMQVVRIDREMWTLAPSDRAMFSGSGRIARIEIRPDRRTVERDILEIEELLKPMGD